MKIEAVIFDCDGTLVDSEGLAVEVVVELLAEAGVAVGADEVMRRFHGRRFATFLQELCAEFPALDAEAMIAGFRARTTAVFRERLQPMPGALELVRGLALDKCVASNGPRAKIETSLEVTGLLSAFGARIVSAYELDMWKPDPGLIHAAAGLMGVPAARCLLVEDSLPGVQAGLAAGARVAAYRLDAAQLGELVGRVQRISHLAEVPALLGC